MMIISTFAILNLFMNRMTDTLATVSTRIEGLALKQRAEISTERVFINATGIVIDVVNKGTIGVHFIKYYVRDAATNNVSTGSLDAFIPANSKKEVIIPGTYSDTANYTIVLIDESGNAYSFKYPFTATVSVQLPSWNQRLLNVTWNPLLPRGYMVATYSIDRVSYFPDGYSVLTGSYITGTLPNDVTAVDNVYFKVVAAKVRTTTKEYYPSLISVNTGALESGASSYLQQDDNIYYVVVRAVPSSYALSVYFTAEQYTVSTNTYYKLKVQDPGTGSPVVVYATARVTDPNGAGYCMHVGDWLYPLIPYRGLTIPSGTWTVWYHAWYTLTNPSTRILWDYGEAYIDISVLKSDGTLVPVVTNFAVATLDSNPTTLEAGSDNFPGYTVAADDDYLVVSYYVCAYFNMAGTTGTVDLGLYAEINETQSRIEAQNTWAYTYSVDVVLTGTSNTAEDWTQIVYGLDLRADKPNVTGYVALHDYVLGAFKTASPGYIALSSVPSTDTFYTETISDSQYPENFRDPATGEFQVKLHLDRAVDWNEEFRVYIDYAPFRPTYYNQYVADTVFVVNNVNTQNVFSIDIYFDMVHNITVSTVNIYIWDYSTSTWNRVYTGSASATYTGNVRVTVGAPNYVSGGSIKIRVESILVSDQARPFEQGVDYLEVVEGVYGAPTLAIATAGSNRVVVYRYLSNQTQIFTLPLTLNNGFAMSAYGTDLYIVYGGNTSNFTRLDLTTGATTQLAQLPVNSTNSLLVLDPNNLQILYLPDLGTSSTFYVYDASADTWVGTITVPIPAPIYTCTITSSLVCINATHLVFYDTASNTITGAYLLPIFVEPLGLLYDSNRDWYIVMFRTGDIYIFKNGVWTAMDPIAPPSEGYSILLAQDPDKLFYLRYLTRELYVIDKTQLTPR
jgi:hypothetical protein